MFQPEKFFSNIFDDRRVTSLRFSSFSEDGITRFINIDTDGKYTLKINEITLAQGEFLDEMKMIDASQNTKLGKTQTVNGVKNAFINAMRENQGVIAKLFKNNKAAFTEFYPQGIKEYSRATKTTMPILVKRIHGLATKYAGQLGSTLVAELQVFENDWTVALSEQTSVDGSLSDSRVNRGVKRTALELLWVKLMHNIAEDFLPDTQKCMSFFNFSLLTGVSHATAAVAPPINQESK